MTNLTTRLTLQSTRFSEVGGSRTPDRISPKDMYYKIWERISVLNNRSNITDNGRNITHRVCSFTGHTKSTNCHVLPHSDQWTAPLEKWMVLIKLFPSNNWMDIRASKMEATNLVALQTACVMEPKNLQFLYFPTRSTLLTLIRFAETNLFEAEKSSESFLGYDSRRLLSGWTSILDGEDVNIYEYEGWILDSDVNCYMTQRVVNNRCVPSLHCVVAPYTELPRTFEPEISNVRLALSPFNVVLNFWKALYRLRDTIVLTSEANERVFELGEYFLSLAEVDTPSAFRDFVRPKCLDFPLPPIVADANTTHRFIHPTVEDGHFLKTRSGKMYPSGTDHIKRKTSRTEQASVNKKTSRPSSSSKGSLHLTNSNDDGVDNSNTGPLISPDSPIPASPALSSTASDGSSAREIEEALTPEDHCIPAFPSLKQEISDVVARYDGSESLIHKCPFESLQEWVNDIERSLRDIRNALEAEAFPEGQITSKLLKQLRYSIDDQREAEMDKLHSLRTKIEEELEDNARFERYT